MRSAFPRAAITALGEAGILGLFSSTDVGGGGGSLADVAEVVERIAGACGSTAMVLAEPDFSLATFLLSVLGEGSFLALLAFLDRHAPDPVTRQVTRLARVDEARHVAFGVAHLEHQAALDPTLRGKLRAAVERRHDALADTAGLNADVFDALVVLAAGEWTPEAIARGHRAVADLHHTMDDGRRQRLARLGFPDDEAAELSALHTRNFM